MQPNSGSSRWASIVGYASIGVGACLHGHRSCGRHQAGTENTGIVVNDIDLVELNEAFASILLRVCGFLVWTKAVSM